MAPKEETTIGSDNWKCKQYFKFISSETNEIVSRKQDVLNFTFFCLTIKKSIWLLMKQSSEISH